jgi:ketosteroid isomerase-like protein
MLTRFSLSAFTLCFCCAAALPAIGCAGSDEQEPISVDQPADAGGPKEQASEPEEDEVAAHIDVIRKRIVANNTQDWEAWQKLHTADAVRTAPGLPGPIEGALDMRGAIEELVITFPDYHLELVDAFGSGDRLVARIHTRATMLGPLQLGETEIPATGKLFEQDWVALLRFEGNKIAAIDEFYDNYDIMLQLGLAQ